MTDQIKLEKIEFLVSEMEWFRGNVICHVTARASDGTPILCMPTQIRYRIDGRWADKEHWMYAQALNEAKSLPTREVVGEVQNG